MNPENQKTTGDDENNAEIVVPADAESKPEVIIEGNAEIMTPGSTEVVAPTTPAKWSGPGLGAYPEPARPRIGDVDIFGALLADARCLNTRRTRVHDMTTFAHYVGMGEPAPATAFLCSGTEGNANTMALGYRSHMMDLGLASGTVNRRLCTLRRAVKLARRLGAISWGLEIDSVPEEPSRDMSGPTNENWLKLLALAKSRADEGSPKGAREHALILLLHDSGLRIGEVSGLDVADFDPVGRRVNIMGKGKRSKAWHSINGQTIGAVVEWLKHRGTEAGPLFLRMSTPTATGGWTGKSGGSCGQGRLTERGIYRVVVTLGEDAGVPVRPHGLRHAAATHLLDITNGNIRSVQRFTRHKNVNTVLKYDDSRRDHAGEMAAMLGGEAPPAPVTPETTASPMPSETSTTPAAPPNDSRGIPGPIGELGEMRRLRSKGWKLAALANHYGVDADAIQDALDGKGWRGVAG